MSDDAESDQQGGSQPTYPPPVNRLFQAGNARNTLHWHEGQVDYPAEFGLTAAHVPHLIAIAQLWLDSEGWSDDEEDLARWAPVHAWRTLGQLRAAQAVAPLLDMLNPLEERSDDWASDEFPQVFGLVGEDALERLDRFLRDGANAVYARICAGHGLERIGALHPELRARCIATLHGVLQGYKDQDPSLNAFLVMYLMELGATESAELIERAYADDRVEEVLITWGEVRRQLGVPGIGLAPDEPHPQGNPLAAMRSASEGRPTPKGFRKPMTGKAQRRAKRKDQRRARRKSRK